MTQNLAYQDKRREELIDGTLVAMSPSPAFNHNRVAFRIAHLFENYLEGKSCTVIADGTDLYLSEKDRFIPDVMVVCDRDKIQWNGVHGAPDLVVEVLSPSTAKNDRWQKAHAYAALGVPEYWIVDPMNQTVEVYTLQNGQYTLLDTYLHHPDYVLQTMSDEEKAELVTAFRCHLYDDFVIRLEDIFSGLI